MERQEALLKLSELIGKDLRLLADKYEVTVFREGRRNKGWAGHVLERHLNLPINSSQFWFVGTEDYSSEISTKWQVDDQGNNVNYDD